MDQKDIKTISRFNKENIACLLSLFIFTLTIFYGIGRLFDNNYASSQAILIIIEGFVGAAMSIMPILIHKIFKIKMSLIIIVFIVVYMVLAIIFGEAFEFYYKVGWWDSMLHAFSSFGIAFAGYCLVDLTIRNSNLMHKFRICLLGAFFITLAVGLLWELIEFTIDTLFGTNMQKFMPEMARFFNKGNTKDMLNGTDEEIAAFFRTPTGYRYALMDTMVDIVWCFVGAVGFGVFGAFTCKKYKAFYSKAFVKEPEEVLVLENPTLIIENIVEV